MRAGLARARAQGKRLGRLRVSADVEAAVRAVLVYDGYVTLSTGKIDALLLDVRVYSSPVHSLLMAVPYRPATEGRQFSVYRPKFISCDLSAPDYEALGSAFFRGVDSHDKGAAVWNQHLDQSL